MNFFKKLAFIAVAILNSQNSFSDTSDFMEGKSNTKNGFSEERSYFNGSGQDLADIVKIVSGYVIDKQSQVANIYNAGEEVNPLSLYETYLPHAAQRKISKFESELLVKYLENPANDKSAQLMAAYHLLSLFNYNHMGSTSNIERLKTLIYAQYFLLRSKQLGVKAKWIEHSIVNIDLTLEKMLPASAALDFTEGNVAQKTYLEAFNYTEENRYIAEDTVLNDLLVHPTNLLTGFYSCTVNLWNAGESDYDDPTALYSYLKASYFGKRITLLAQRAEKEWQENPDTHELFRLAFATGAFTAQPRRWLAKFHNDLEAVNLIDAELNQWMPKYATFYSFPLAVMQFSEPQNIASGFYALQAGFDSCAQDASNIFCMDHPRASYNTLSFVLFASQYYLKMGDINTASTFLTFRYNPALKYDAWNLGHDIQEHAEQNLMQISALYKNTDFSDDPSNVFIKRRKWGPESASCQLCHQAQGTTYTEEEKNTVRRLDEAHLYVRDWPAVTTTWYGSVIKNSLPK